MTSTRRNNDDRAWSQARLPVFWRGIAGSAGFAIGQATVIAQDKMSVVHRRIAVHQAPHEVERFDAAVALATEGLRSVSSAAGEHLGSAESTLLEAYILMLQDEILRSKTVQSIEEGRRCAEWAVETSIGELAAKLAAVNDPYLAERSHDVGFVGDRILRALTGHQRDLSFLGEGEPKILVAHDLSPADTVGLSKDSVKALVTELGTKTSHTAILARALDIPAVVGVGNILNRVSSGDLLVVDGVRGRVLVSPSEQIIAETSAQAKRYQAVAACLRQFKDRPTQTQCGVPIELRANIEFPDEAPIAIQEGARGIGLYRTEFLCLNRSTPPEESEQYGSYRRIVEAVRPLPVTLRTFDLGGDKFFTSNREPETNPALGMRAVRYCLAHSDLLLTQLRAMVRASTHGPVVRIMIPMVSSLEEIVAVQGLLQRAVEDVRTTVPSLVPPPLGMMVEVPAAAILADGFAARVDFMSIGTNDLVQYVLAADRSNQQLVHLASPFNPAVLRLVQMVIEAGGRHRIPISVCGAMASDPLAVILLVGMGLREMSLEASAVLGVKETLGRVNLEEASEAAQWSLTQMDAHTVEQGLASRFAPRLANLFNPDSN